MIGDEELLPGWVLVSGVCQAPRCPKPNFTRQVREQHKDDEILYCSRACTRRAAKERSQVPCPTAGCENLILQVGQPCCGLCWSAIAGMCKGKKRLTQLYALKVQNRTTWLATDCQVCGTWHNTSHEVVDAMGLREKVRAVMAGIREARGGDYLAELVDGFRPGPSDRKAWQRHRPHGRPYEEAA